MARDPVFSYLEAEEVAALLKAADRDRTLVLDVRDDVSVGLAAGYWITGFLPLGAETALIDCGMNLSVGFGSRPVCDLLIGSMNDLLSTKSLPEFWG